MKMTAFRTLMCIAVMTLIATALEFPVRLAAQGTESQNHGHKHVRYVVKVLSTLGGTSGVGNSVNNRGWVAGAANLTGDTTEHVALWRNGVITDLGTLGGPDSFINTPVKNERGEIEGFAETSTPDPLGEAFCAGVTFFGFHDGVTCLGFVWRDGVMAPLPPLAGGNNSQASGVNNRGQVVGFAENGTQDPSCTPPQVLQFEAVIWGPKKGRIQQLPPLSGDSDGIGVAINDEGEVTGCTGVCANVGGASCTHAVVWKHGSPRDIGGLGPLNFGAGINNRGQVLGLSLLPDGVFVDQELAQVLGSRAGLWAAALSHEISHVVHRDWARRYLFQKSLEEGGTSQIVLGDIGGFSGSWVDVQGASGRLASFCQAMELEADADGLKLMTRTGFHPDFVPALHHLIEAQPKQSDARHLDSLHPSWDERDQNLQKLYAAAGKGYDRLWLDRYASPGGNPPIVVYAGLPKTKRGLTGELEVQTLLHCLNLSGSVEVVLRFTSADSEFAPELRQFTGCTSNRTLITSPAQPRNPQSQLPHAG